jgi:hypothetical protein
MTGKNRTEKFIMKPPFSKSTLFSEYIEKGTVGAGTKDLENIWLAWAHLPTDRLRHGNQPACNCQLTLTSTPANATSSSLWFCQAGRSRNAISPIKTTTFDLAYGFGSPESPTRQNKPGPRSEHLPLAKPAPKNHELLKPIDMPNPIPHQFSKLKRFRTRPGELEAQRSIDFAKRGRALKSAVHTSRYMTFRLCAFKLVPFHLFRVFGFSQSAYREHTQAGFFSANARRFRIRFAALCFPIFPGPHRKWMCIKIGPELS